ncbi:MAG: NAD-dependent epimerase/dehydratase family protein [Candidatus Peribacteraceae bacterium]|nr:NAD-dependent epimerase/dehydratase family protein [Candidatus Peribacteraceae bacterium]
MKNTQIFVLGGNGFVGREFIKALKKSGYQKIISASRSLPKVKITGVQYVAGVDLDRPNSLDKVIRKNFVVVNLAGLISFRRKDSQKLFAVNARGSLALLRACEQKKVRRLIQISSTAALGFSPSKIHEATKFDWQKYEFLSYSHSKFFANKAIDNSKLPTNILFPPLVLGPGDPTSAQRIFDFVRGRRRVAVPPGSNAFIDVRDLARAIRLTLEKARANDNFIVIGQNFSIQSLFAAAAKILRQKTEIKTLPAGICSLTSGCARVAEYFGLPIPSENIFLGFQKRAFDSRKITRALGFRPRFTLEKSLRDSFETLPK